ncbi:MAG: YoaK family protein [Pseudomonadota bacterium]|nr:YoaK family protein [Pseudomonadota bacterium]
MLTRLPVWILVGSVMLALNAGFINSVALLSFASNAVSHVTGTATILADAVVTGQSVLVFHTATIVLSFIGGAVLSGIIVGNEALALGRRYGLALAIEALLLIAAWKAFHMNHMAAEWLASAACGLQNAMVATYSGSVIRTTHLTGIVSDLGAALGNLLSGRGMLKAQFALQSAIFVAFIAGAILGSLLFRRFGYDAVLVNGVWVGFVALCYVFMLARRKRELSR